MDGLLHWFKPDLSPLACPANYSHGYNYQLGQLQLLGNFVQQWGFSTCKFILDQESNIGAEVLNIGEEFCVLAFQLLIYSLQCHIII